ncbi:hypothetical protein QJQ45_007575 [Haematococcus lacustris]|nr:hypothetical protein QJQ45_007575 [Haematococcus lacustris]
MLNWVLLAWAFARAPYHHHQLYDKLGEAVLQGLQGSHLMPRLQQASRAAPTLPSSSSSSVAATHSRSGHGTRSTSPLAGLPLSLPAPPPSPASPLPSTPLARGPPQPSPLPTPLAQLSSTCLVQLLWAFASHEHCQAALLRAAAPVLSARILQGQLSSRRVACVAWAYARLQQLEPRLLAAILCTGGRPGCGAGSWRAAAQLVYLQPQPAGAGVRQLGLAPSASVLLEALAPWQPRSGKARERLGRQHLVAATCDALEQLPVNPSP